jgi:hydrogenase maturation protease
MIPKILIAGVGSPYRHDDGIGIKIIKILKEQNNPNFTLFDGGTDGFSLIDKLQEHEQAIIIDAVAMNADPGAVRVFSPNEAKLHVQNDALSTHGFGLAEMLNLVEELEIKTDIKVIGIQSKDISLGEGLSDVVSSQIPRVLEIVAKCSK